MGNIWIYIVCWLFGCICGIALWEQIGVDNVFKGKVKIKQRGRGNEQSTPIKVETGLKTSRKDRRKARRVDKQ